jgi:short-subunit dehydrogenase
MAFMKKVIIIGASSGIGAAIARAELKAGSFTTLVARREEELLKLVKEFPDAKYCVLKHDVKNTSEVAKLFSEIIKSMDGLDEIYYASGVLHKVELDEFNTSKDVDTISVNLLGAIAWCNQSAEYFQKLGKGKIIGISSIAGERGRIGNPSYNTSKAALNIYLEALRNRLSRKGILVLTAKPGFIDTDMTKGLKGLFWLISPEEAADIIRNSAKKNKEVIFVPAKWWLVATIINLIPNFIFKKLNI